MKDGHTEAQIQKKKKEPLKLKKMNFCTILPKKGNSSSREL